MTRLNLQSLCGSENDRAQLDLPLKTLHAIGNEIDIFLDSLTVEEIVELADAARDYLLCTHLRHTGISFLRLEKMLYFFLGFMTAYENSNDDGRTSDEDRETLKASFKGWTYANIVALSLEEVYFWTDNIRPALLDSKKSKEIPHSARALRFILGLDRELDLYKPRVSVLDPSWRASTRN